MLESQVTLVLSKQQNKCSQKMWGKSMQKIKFRVDYEIKGDLEILISKPVIIEWTK